jgi:hypothetical protein
MEARKWNFNGRNLPLYLGYGILDENSVMYENGVIAANYTLECDNSVVHKVTWQKDRCELKTLLQGKSCITNWSPDLNQALTSGFLIRDFTKDMVLDFLMERTSEVGNVYIQKPEPKVIGKQRIVHFPAGLLMSFRLPLPEKSHVYDSFLNNIKSLGHISFFRELKTYLLLTDAELKVSIQPMVIAEFIIPLAFITSAAKTFSESGVINPSKQYRLMVGDSFQAETTLMETFIGNEKHPYFAIYYAECSDDKHPELTRLFIESLKGLKDELIKKEDKTETRNNQPPSNVEGVFNEETCEWEGDDYPEPPQREKESWVSVTQDLKTEELEIPYYDSNLLLWIHKSFDYKHHDGFWLFKYDLFSTDFRKMWIKEGNFTCTGISDFIQNIGCGNSTTIKFEISDNNKVVYSFRGFAQMENGVLEVISFMRSLNRFSDWNDYETMKALKKSLGKTDEELDKMIMSELYGTGISFK